MEECTNEAESLMVKLAVVFLLTLFIIERTWIKQKRISCTTSMVVGMVIGILVGFPSKAMSIMNGILSRFIAV